MLDVLHACLATVAGRTGRIPSLGSGRDAVMRLGLAFALVVALVGALNWHASGMDMQVAQAQAEGR